MGWNNGNEKNRFEKRQEKLAERYRQAGMTEEQIRIMYEFDREQYRRERIERLHTQSVLPTEYEADEDDDEKLSIYRKFSDRLTCSIESEGETDEWNWLDDLGNISLLNAIRDLSPDDRKIWLMWAVERKTQSEIAVSFETSQQNIQKKISRIKKYFLKRVVF